MDKTLNTYSHMHQNILNTTADIIKLKKDKLNNSVIEFKSTILLKHKETLDDQKKYHTII